MAYPVALAQFRNDVKISAFLILIALPSIRPSSSPWRPLIVRLRRFKTGNAAQGGLLLIKKCLALRRPSPAFSAAKLSPQVSESRPQSPRPARDPSRERQRQAVPDARYPSVRPFPSGRWFFNPICWQLVFVLGFTMSQGQELGGWIQKNIKPLRWLAWSIVVAAAFVVWFSLWPDPTHVPEPKLFFVAEKTFVTPMRLGQFLALAIVCSAAYPRIDRLWSGGTKFLSTLGRNSLQVFCVGSLLSLSCQIIRFYFDGGIQVDVLLLISGVFLLWLTAWVNEWRERAKGS
jgi:OpgC protein